MQIFAKVIIAAAAGVNGLKMIKNEKWLPGRFGRSPAKVRAPIIQDLFDNWDNYAKFEERRHLFWEIGGKPEKEFLEHLFDTELLQLFPECCKKHKLFQDHYSVLDDEKQKARDPSFYKINKVNMESYPAVLKKAKENKEHDIKLATEEIKEVEEEIKKQACATEHLKHYLEGLSTKLQGKQEELKDFGSLPTFTEDEEEIKKLRQKLENAPHEKIKKLYYKLEKKGMLGKVLQTLRMHDIKDLGNNVFGQIVDLEDEEQLKLASELQKLDKSVPQKSFYDIVNRTWKIIKL